MKTVAVIVLITCFDFFAMSQSDSLSFDINEIVITGLKETDSKETSVEIVQIKATEINRMAAFNISDALSKIPGISQLSTGVSISKPVIRGLYGNRILTLVSGLRFDNQQWQDEHGLGLSDLGIDRVEIIKGPLAVVYGSESLGGLINVIEESKAPENKMIGDLNLRFHSNTLGGLFHAGLKGNRNNKWWRVRAGYESNGDYSDGSNTRVLNSRNNGIYFKGTFGFNKKRTTSVFNYLSSFNNFGFIMADLNDFMTPDARWSRSMEGPHHTVILNLLSSQNTIRLNNSTLKVNAGFQSNSRMENEGGGKISLNMLLSSVLYHLEWLKFINSNIELIVGQNTTYTNNTNFGSRIIIPDAHTLEFGGSGFLKFHLGKIIVETGAGVNNKWIKALLTRLVNTPDRDIAPFSRFKTSVNGLAGFTYNPSKFWNVKLNLATGFRSPNLAELSSNGLHEGTFRYEIGDPDLKNEQNINSDAGIYFNQQSFSFSVSGFYNRFFNYIYLSPTSETLYGFNIYRYMQQNAFLSGGEATVAFTPKRKLKGFKLSSAYSIVYAKTADNNFIPFTPPGKVASLIEYQHDISPKLNAAYLSFGFDYVFSQNCIAPAEINTPAYFLLNAKAGVKILFNKGYMVVGISANNLLNELYYDHLSRLKDYGIYNIGRNISLNFSIPLTFNYSLTQKQKQQ